MSCDYEGSNHLKRKWHSTCLSTIMVKGVYFKKTQNKRTQTEALSVCQKSHITRLELCVSCHNESQCPCSCFVLSLSLFFLICTLCFSDMEGFVNGEQSQVVSQGEAGVDLSPTNPQLSAARDHMVQRRAQDPPQQPHVIFSLYVDQSQLNGPLSHRQAIIPYRNRVQCFFIITLELPETRQECLRQNLSLIMSVIIRTPVDFWQNVIEG